MLGDSPSDFPHFDFQVSLLSLPGVFNTDLDTIPATVPYVSAEPQLIQAWRAKLDGVTRFRVGIAWQGSPSYVQDRFRSIPLVHFARLAELPAVQLVSLQKGHGVEQLDELRDRLGVIEFGSEFDAGSGAFTDSAAVLQNLDLLVTSDTALAHLAGALGVRVWVALSFIPDWRWLMDRDDSPWYPTMRLFRQRRRGDWDEVFERLRSALAELIKQAPVRRS